MNRLASWLLAVCLLALLGQHVLAPRSYAQEGAAEAASPEADGDAAAAEEEVDPVDQLALSQEQLHDRYERFRRLLLERADFERAENPERAELLERVVELGNEQLISLQLEQLAGLLRQEQYSRAINNQRQVSEDLQVLLELLLTENRPHSNRSQQARIRDYLRKLERIIVLQQSIERRTETGDVDRLARDEEGAADRARELHELIRENEGVDEPQPGEGEGEGESPAEGQEQPPAEGEGDAPQPGEGSAEGEGEGQEPGQAEGEGEGQAPGEGQGESQGQGEGQGEGQGQGQGQGQGEGQGQGQGQQQGEGEGQDQPAGQQPQHDFPGRRRIAEAEQRMREAQQKLEDANRRGAREDAEEATRLLREAQAELEEILRQLREEEIERMLALLESRFRRMLEMQLRVYEGTMRLAHVPADRRSRETDVQAGRLSFEEKKIVLEAEQALGLLHEEGSSSAFPEAVEQLLADMNQVAERLNRTLIDHTTQGIESDIIASLEEMIAALQQAQKDLEEQRQNPPQQQGPPGDQPLVDQIAELKMIRALHDRVLRRTQRYAMLLEDEDDPVGQAENDELREAIQRLAERQERIRETIRDILLERNQ